MVASPIPSASSAASTMDREKVLPLPGWLVKAYFIFPVILYIPDAIFNYYVYSDGWNTDGSSPLVQVGKVALVSFLSIGVVGMAYLLSVIAPWHWGQGHRIQAFFCALGVVIATAITTWNSLAYRSTSFVEFNTDKWAYNLWPTLADNKISITMILVSVAPPFWGLFWAIVQPTETGRSLRQLQESHEERLLRVQHEAEVKRLKAEANAKVREAQLRGMAQTATAAREQAAEVLRRKKAEEKAAETQGEPVAIVTTDPEQAIPTEPVTPATPAASAAAPKTTRTKTARTSRAKKPAEIPAEPLQLDIVGDQEGDASMTRPSIPTPLQALPTITLTRDDDDEQQEVPEQAPSSSPLRYIGGAADDSGSRYMRRDDESDGRPRKSGARRLLEQQTGQREAVKSGTGG